jgi:hypothetical protein
MENDRLGLLIAAVDRTNRVILRNIVGHDIAKPVSTYHATIYSVAAEAFPQDQKHDIRGVFL